MNITSNTNYPSDGTRKLVEEVVPPHQWLKKAYPQPAQAEELLVMLLMLLQLPKHLGKLQGPNGGGVDPVWRRTAAG